MADSCDIISRKLFFLLIKDLVDHFVDSSLLVPGAGDDVLVVVTDVATQNGRSLLGDKDGGAVGRSPGVEKVVLARGDEPLAAVGELQGEYTALVEVELVFVRFGAVEYFHVGVLHSHGQPVSSRAVAEAEYLGAEVMLLQLSSFPQIPGSHSVIQTSSPQLSAVS